MGLELCGFDLVYVPCPGCRCLRPSWKRMMNKPTWSAIWMKLMIRCKLNSGLLKSFVWHVSHPPEQSHPPVLQIYLALMLQTQMWWFFAQQTQLFFVPKLYQCCKHRCGCLCYRLSCSLCQGYQCCKHRCGCCFLCYRCSCSLCQLCQCCKHRCGCSLHQSCI